MNTDPLDILEALLEAAPQAGPQALDRAVDHEMLCSVIHDAEVCLMAHGRLVP